MSASSSSMSVQQVAVSANGGVGIPRDVRPGVVVVDAFSTGEVMAERIREMGYPLVLVYTNTKSEGGVFSNELQGDAEIVHNGSIRETAAAIRSLPFPVEHVMAGAENGVFLADALAEELKLRVRNSMHLSQARRNKWLQQEAVRAAGVRAAKQVLATEWGIVEAFLRDWNPNPFKVIVKPNQSAGSDDVFLCTDRDQVRAAFNCINGAINSVGEVNEGVLVMEYLEGSEYVIDSVSLAGERKAVAVWKYDKRHVNGQFNVYFGMELFVEDSELYSQLIEYNFEVLEALEINNGPSHMEVIVTRDGPCLVEVGARCHGGHGTWRNISNAAFGYSQVDATLYAYLTPEAFQALPTYPTNPRCFGKEVFLVSYREGIVRNVPGMSEVVTLPSFHAKDIACKPGQRLFKTVDLFTMPGRVQLLHESVEQIELDYNIVHKLLERHQMFELEQASKAQTYLAESGPAEDDGPAADSPAEDDDDEEDRAIPSSSSTDGEAE